MRGSLENRLKKAVMSALTGMLAGAYLARKFSPRDDSQLVVYGLVGAAFGFIVGFLLNFSLKKPFD